MVHIDRFGNLITNIDAAVLQDAAISGGRSLGVEINNCRISHIGRTYADAAAGQPLVLIGSRGYLEIAVNGGSAQLRVNARKGDSVRVQGLGF